MERQHITFTFFLHQIKLKKKDCTFVSGSLLMVLDSSSAAGWFLEKEGGLMATYVDSHIVIYNKVL